MLGSNHPVYSFCPADTWKASHRNRTPVYAAQLSTGSFTLDCRNSSQHPSTPGSQRFSVQANANTLKAKERCPIRCDKDVTQEPAFGRNQRAPHVPELAHPR